MKLNYDKKTDSLSVILVNDIVDDSDEVSPGIIVDYNIHGNAIAIEFLNASKKIYAVNKFISENQTAELEFA
jgi:uncharacterized protein YuzE